MVYKEKSCGSATDLKGDQCGQCERYKCNQCGECRCESETEPAHKPTEQSASSDANTAAPNNQGLYTSKTLFPQGTAQILNDTNIQDEINLTDSETELESTQEYEPITSQGELIKGGLLKDGYYVNKERRNLKRKAEQDEEQRTEGLPLQPKMETCKPLNRLAEALELDEEHDGEKARLRCHCECRCKRRPGRLIQCCQCGYEVGIGCCCHMEFGDNGLCHVYNQAIETTEQTQGDKWRQTQQRQKAAATRQYYRERKQGHATLNNQQGRNSNGDKPRKGRTRQRNKTDASCTTKCFCNDDQDSRCTGECSLHRAHMGSCTCPKHDVMRAIWEAENADDTKTLEQEYPENEGEDGILQQILSTEMHSEVENVKPEPIPDELLHQIKEKLRFDCAECYLNLHRGLKEEQKRFYLPIWVEKRIKIGTDIMSVMEQINEGFQWLQREVEDLMQEEREDIRKAMEKTEEVKGIAEAALYIRFFTDQKGVANKNPREQRGITRRHLMLCGHEGMHI